jgi:hypothetical protein
VENAKHLLSGRSDSSTSVVSLSRRIQLGRKFGSVSVFGGRWYAVPDKAWQSGPCGAYAGVVESWCNKRPRCLRGHPSLVASVQSQICGIAFSSKPLHPAQWYGEGS